MDNLHLFNMLRIGRVVDVHAEVLAAGIEEGTVRRGRPREKRKLEVKDSIVRVDSNHSKRAIKLRISETDQNRAQLRKYYFLIHTHLANTGPSMRDPHTNSPLRHFGWVQKSVSIRW